MRILVCGGRDYSDREKLTAVLKEYICDDLTIIQGGARGADELALKWAEAFGVARITFPAHWEKYGKRARYIRNVEMLNEGDPDLVIAFPGGKGTQMMITLAEAANVKVRKVE